MIRLDGGLFFATADALEDRLREVVHSTPDLTGIVLDCEGINFVDSQGSAKLADIANLADESAVSLRLARLKPAVRATLDRDGVIERIGADMIHGNIYRAVQAEMAAVGRDRDGSLGLATAPLTRTTSVGPHVPTGCHAGASGWSVDPRDCRAGVAALGPTGWVGASRAGDCAMPERWPRRRSQRTSCL